MKKLLFSVTFLVAIGFIQAAQAQTYTFSRDLTVGATGADVVALQDALIQSGYTIPSVVSGVVPKGYFGAQTRAAVVAFQMARGVPGTGYVGPLTRRSLNGGVSNNPTITVLSPNGGESLLKGTQQTIRWTWKSPVSDQIGSIWLSSYTPPCAEPTNAIRCMIAVRAPVLIARGIDLSSGAYTWTAGNVNENLACTANGYCPFDWTPVSDGQYKIQICNSNTAGSGVCDSSNGYFSVVSNVTTNNKPVINGLDAPTSLTLNQTGTWSVRATDPQNQALSYTVDWGESTGCLSGYVCNSMPANVGVQQSSTFTHSYSTPGVYTVKFTVTNATGQSAQTSATVTVPNVGTVSSLNILSPMAGDVLIKNTPYVIRWTAPAYFRATYANIQLIKNYVCPSGMACIAIAYAPQTIASNISINQNSYTWNVGSVLDYLNQTEIAQDGSEYKIQICEVSSSNCATSGKFTISASNSNLPDINILSPNGGEIWSTGSNRNVMLQFSGSSSQIGNVATISLVDSRNVSINLGEFAVSGVGTQTYQVNLATTIPTGIYRIYTALYSTGVTCAAIGCPPAPRTMQAYDYSDNTFTVSSEYYAYPGPDYLCPVGYVCSPVAH